jgi:hypothetical protein
MLIATQASHSAMLNLIRIYFKPITLCVGIARLSHQPARASVNLPDVEQLDSSRYNLTHQRNF